MRPNSSRSAVSALCVACLLPSVVAANNLDDNPTAEVPSTAAAASSASESSALPTTIEAGVVATTTAAPPSEPARSACEIDPSACQPAEHETAMAHPVFAVAQIASMPHGDVGSKTSERFVMPSGQAEVSGEIALVTSEAIVTPHRLKFGDLALMRPRVRRALGERVELSLGTSLLAKEPSVLSDWVWQGASLGAVIEPWPGYAAVLTAQGGPMLDGTGSVWSTAAGLTAKWALDNDARVLLSVSDSFTALDAQGRMAAQTWLDELMVGAEVQLGRRQAAAWVGANYALPLASAGTLPGSQPAVALKPSARLDLQVGGVLRAGEQRNWDLFAYYAWIDRGEKERPESRLPILEGGFDQQQVVIGVSHRFGGKRQSEQDSE